MGLKDALLLLEVVRESRRSRSALLILVVMGEEFGWFCTGRCVVETRVNGGSLSELPVGGDELVFRFLRALDCR